MQPTASIEKYNDKIWLSRDYKCNSTVGRAKKTIDFNKKV